MRSVVTVLLVASALVAFSTCADGLYADDAKAIKDGDVCDRDYFQAKFDMMMLDMAIKQRQPEGKIGLNLVSTVHNLEDMNKKYPNHEGIKKWKDHAEEIQKKIDPNADRRADWKPGMPWDEANFVQYWVNFYTTKECLKNNDREKAKLYFSNVKQNYEILNRPDRLKDYPDDLKKWFEDSKEEVEKIDKQLKGK
jgi:hypothetical protein